MAIAVDVLQPMAVIRSRPARAPAAPGPSEFLRLQSKLTTCLTRRTPRQGSRRRNCEQSHDPRSAGLSGMSHAPQSVRDRSPDDGSDIACAGFGPAMGGFLTTLTQAWTQNPADPAFESRVAPGMPLQVLCYERADDLAAGVSGVVTRAQGIRTSFPALDPRRFRWPPRSNRNAFSTCSIPSAPAGAPRFCVLEIFFLVLEESGGLKTTPLSCPGRPRFFISAAV